MIYFKFALWLLIFLTPIYGNSAPKVTVGIETLFSEDYENLLSNKRIGIITNQTAINSQMIPTHQLLKANAKQYGYTVTALFSPEHGLYGAAHAGEDVEDSKDPQGIPIFSLHGKTRRPTPEMLKKVDLLIYDIQDIGARSYTYVTTLFYAMEEAAKVGIPVVVLDRPNPINGIVVDGPMLEDKWRSMVGYINVPYCHGMTVGELSQFFNTEYKVGCKLVVVPMRGWKRKMSFQDTGLVWIPTSPHIPEPTTPYYYPVTGLLGELSIVSIGVGYTLPFKVIGAPWINGKTFAEKLNAQNFPGVQFLPFYFRPFYGKFSGEDCQGVQIVITNPLTYKPVSTQYLIIGLIKNLYPAKMKEAMAKSKSFKEMFCKVNGTEEVFKIMVEKTNIVWKLRSVHQKQREDFLDVRKKYLIADYN